MTSQLDSIDAVYRSERRPELRGGLFAESDLWPYKEAELLDLLASFLPISDSGDRFGVVLPGAKLTTDILAASLGVLIDSPSEVKCNHADVVVGRVPSGRHETVAYSASLQPDDRHRHIWVELELGARDLLDRLPHPAFLAFRFPWDIFANIRYLLSDRWELVRDHLINRWALYERSSGIWVSKSASVDESVIFEGEAVVGGDAIIKHGPVLGEKVIVSAGCIVEQYCRVAKYSLLGPRAHVGHCAEVSGILCSDSRAWHHGYLRGILGIRANLGGGTACGTDRFDKGATLHQREGYMVPIGEGANEVYLGTDARTGANTCLTAGSILGAGSWVGPGMCFSGYVEDGRWIWPRQIQGTLRVR